MVQLVKTLPANPGDTRDTGSIPGVGRFPEGEHGNRSNILEGEISWTEEPGGLQFMGLQSWASEKAMAPHSSTLACKIPWTEEPGRLQSMGSLRVGHD